MEKAKATKSTTATKKVVKIVQEPKEELCDGEQCSLEQTPVEVPKPTKVTKKSKAPKKVPSEDQPCVDEQPAEDGDIEDTPKPAKAKKSTKKADSEEVGKRYFRILPETISPAIDTELISSNGGRYVGNTPMQAAKKAFTQIARKCGKEECKYTFSIQESTQKSGKKVFAYEGERIKRVEPHVISKDGNTFNIKYDTHVRSHKEPKSADTEKPPKATKKVKKEKATEGQ